MNKAEQRTEDECLVRAARDGDPTALSVLIARQMPMIRRCAAGYRVPGMETDDLIQEGLLGLLKAVRLYDNSLSEFSTYARLCVSSGMASAAREGLGKKNGPLRNYVLLDDLAEQLQHTESETLPEELVLLQERSREWKAKIETLLSPFERQVLNAYLGGHSYSEIASNTSSSTKAVDNALQRVRRKLRPE